MLFTNSVSINFRVELIEPSAREVFIFSTLMEKEERVRRGEENMAQT